MNKNATQQLEQNTDRQQMTDKLVAWLPRIAIVWLLLIVLLAGISVWERGFLENHMPGIYWLFVAYGKIAMLFFVLFYLTSLFVCLFLGAEGIAGFFESKPIWARYRSSNTRLLVVIRLLLAVFVCIGSVWLRISPFGHIVDHVDTVQAHGSVYHLAYATSGIMSEWERGSSSHYMFATCNLSGIVCRHIDDIRAYWVFSDDVEKTTLLNYDPVTDQIQVVEKGATIYTYQP